MNFIKQLQFENMEMKVNAVKTDDAIRDLKCYLLSEKFRCGDKQLDGYVNISDVLNRLGDISAELFQHRTKQELGL